MEMWEEYYEWGGMGENYYEWGGMGEGRGGTARDKGFLHPPLQIYWGRELAPLPTLMHTEIKLQI